MGTVGIPSVPQINSIDDVGAGGGVVVVVVVVCQNKYREYEVIQFAKMWLCINTDRCSK